MYVYKSLVKSHYRSWGFVPRKLILPSNTRMFGMFPADCLLSFLSKTSSGSRLIEIEIEYGRGKGKKLVFFILSLANHLFFWLGLSLSLSLSLSHSPKFYIMLVRFFPKFYYTYICRNEIDSWN